MIYNVGGCTDDDLNFSLITVQFSRSLDTDKSFTVQTMSCLIIIESLQHFFGQVIF